MNKTSEKKLTGPVIQFRTRGVRAMAKAKTRKPMSNEDGTSTFYTSACDRCSAAFFGIPGKTHYPPSWLVVALDVQADGGTSEIRGYCESCAPAVREFLKSHATGESVRAWLEKNPGVRPPGVAT